MRKFIALVILVPLSLFGQSNFDLSYGVHLGLVANVGSHKTSLGLQFNTYVGIPYAQLNFASNVNLYAHSLGNRKKFIESRNALGVVLSAVKGKRYSNFEFDALNHQSLNKYGIGYNYILYHDNRGTSQHSGGFALHFNKVSIYHENDAFTGQAEDRFRTAIARISYTDSLFKYSIGMNLWTGDSRNAPLVSEKSPICLSGFKNLEDRPYGKTSHGILFGEVKMNGIYQQNPNIRLGIDAEGIRHFVQNRMFHDLIFMPKNYERKTPHYPTIDENGCYTLDKSKRRKPSPYIQLGLNDVWSN